MPCFKPLRAWQSPAGGPVAFAPSRSHCNPLELPCGQCVGCRLRRSADWATRCVHEASLHDDNCFITLTYDEDHVPWDGSLNKKHLQDFMKRLRWHYRDRKILHFACGEYGNKLQRPHYHAILFNHNFEDKERWSINETSETFVSEILERLWPFGFSTIGHVTWESAAYVARYTTKKRTGKDAAEYYWRPLSTDLEIQLQPEFATMSLKPAIAKEWYATYKDDCYPSDFVTNQGKKLRVPKYYDKLLHDQSPKSLEALKKRRREKARERDADTTPQRLREREKCAIAKLNRLNRPIEG